MVKLHSHRSLISKANNTYQPYKKSLSLSLSFRSFIYFMAFVSKYSIKLFSNQTRGIFLPVKSDLGPQISQPLHYTRVISSKYPLNLPAGLGSPSHLFRTWWKFHLVKALRVNSRSSSTVGSTRAWYIQFFIATESILRESQLFTDSTLLHLKWWLLDVLRV